MQNKTDKQGGPASMAGIDIGSEADSTALAARLADLLQPGDVVLLDGALAAGKTFLVRALVAALGSTDAVTSPTYTIANIYDAPQFPVLHVDAYRLNDAQEFYHLGLEDYLETGVTLIEWGSRVDTMFPEALHLSIAFDGSDDTARRITITGHGDRWQGVAARLARRSDAHA